MAPTGTAGSSGTEPGSSRCRRRSAGGQHSTTTPARAPAPAITVAVTSHDSTPAKADGATTATSTTPPASASAWSTMAAATATAGHTPAYWARIAAPATAPHLQGMHYPDL